MKFSRSTLSLLGMSVTVAFASSDRRSTTKRLRHQQKHKAVQSSDGTVKVVLPSFDRALEELTSGPVAILSNMPADEKPGGGGDDARLLQEQDGYFAMMEVFESLAASLGSSMSFAPTTLHPTAAPQQSPSMTTGPVTQSPSAPTYPTITTAAPISATTPPSPSPALVVVPTTAAPAVLAPTPPPIDAVVDTPAPATVTSAPATAAPSTIDQTGAPVVVPLASDYPSESPTTPPTAVPTLSKCPGITAAERVAQILAILDEVASAAEIRDGTLAQGKATEWLIDQDSYQICPDSYQICSDNPKIIQRWSMAVLYYSTGGDDWFQCSAGGADNCGRQKPFRKGADRFLAASNECEWAGIVCNKGCVTEIVFEENNLAGTIPTEIGLLSTLKIWGMERGALTSTIPTEVGRLTNLTFIDLDYNQLTGTLPSELYSLTGLTQLDLNNNQFTGDIGGLTGYSAMEFLQLHDNQFTGTIPSEIGMYSALTTFTVHESLLSGDMPVEVCDLTTRANKGGVLTTLIADCSPPNPNVNCSCCTDCRHSQ